MVNQALNRGVVYLLWAIVALSVVVSVESSSLVKHPKSSAGAPKLILVINTNREKSQQGSAQRISAAVRKIFNCSTVIEHYVAADPLRVEQLKPAGIILSGQGSMGRVSCRFLEGRHKTYQAG